MKYFYTIMFLAVMIIVGIVSYQTNKVNLLPEDVIRNLERKGSNRFELEKAITYFREKGDSLQLEALFFLIGNMEDHSYVTFALYDSTGEEIDFNVLNYPDYNTVIAALDSMETETGELHFDRKERFYDLKEISSEYLIENVELAFKAWKTLPWASYLSYEDFCEYVLPYRGSNEPLELWREHFFNRYQNLPGELSDPQDCIEVGSRINDDLKSWFTFNPLFYCHPTDLGLSEMMETHSGRCEDMTNLTIYAMRAVGLAVTSDYTPHWADAGGNHAWNAILVKNGEVIPFMGCEANPGKYSLTNRFAKVYRKTYSKQKGNLVFILEDWEKAPPWLSGKYYRDVTRYYIDVVDVVVDLEKSVPDSTNYAYLSVFNSGEWKAIHWGKIEGDSVRFCEMGSNIVYLPMYYVHEELEPAASPFILKQKGEIRRLDGLSATNSVTARLISTTRKKIADATVSRDVVFLESGEIYKLFFWEDEWVSVGKQQATDEPMLFHNIPANRLYWLIKEGSRKEERIFTLENGKQVWW